MENNVCYISTKLIYPNLYQPRKYFDENAIDDLAVSIQHYGIIQPLSVRKMSSGTYELVAGERRLRAAKKAGLETVPVIIVDISDRDSAAIALLENIQREDLNYIEEAEAYNNLIKEHGYTQEKLAEILGKNQSTIANKLRLLKLDSDIREIILSNNLTERHARALLKISDPVLKKKVLKTIISKKLNVSNSEALINRELIKFNKNSSTSKKSRISIKKSLNPRIYINTVKQVFNKYNIEAQYDLNEFEDHIEVKISIPKNI